MGPLNATRRAEAFLDALNLRPDQAEELLTLPAARLVEALAHPRSDSCGSVQYLLRPGAGRRAA
jgi:carboxylesterase type B